MAPIDRVSVDQAIEELGSLVSSAGGRGDAALDVFKDVASEVERLREAIHWYVRSREADLGARPGSGTSLDLAWRNLMEIAHEPR